MHVKLKGLQTFYDRHFVQRCYVRINESTRVPIDLKKFPLNTPEFVVEYQRIWKDAEVFTANKPGTLGLLIDRYRSSTVFKALAPKTQKDYERYFRYLEPLNDVRLERLKPHTIRMIRDQAANKGYRTGDYVKQVLSLLFRYAVEYGFMETNPAANLKNVKRPKNLPLANRPWTASESVAVLDAAPHHMKLPIALMMYCGLDPQDAVSLPRNAIKDGMIDTRRGKTGVAVLMPLPKPVVLAILNSPKHNASTLVANSSGQPWTVSGFRASFGTLRNRLLKEGKIEKGLTQKGLRHTVATRLAEIGFNERNIADILGHETPEMARRYSKRANLTKSNTAVIASLDAHVEDIENKARAKNVKPS